MCGRGSGSIQEGCWGSGRGWGKGSKKGLRVWEGVRGSGGGWGLEWIGGLGKGLESQRGSEGNRMGVRALGMVRGFLGGVSEAKSKSQTEGKIQYFTLATLINGSSISCVLCFV